MDMNETRYAEELGLSTALRTDEKMGMKEIRFPMAPCLDSNLVGLVRVQKTCGQYFDVRLTRKDVIITDPQAGAVGTVDRVKVMEQIAKQVNAQVGFEMMRVVIPVDANGKQLTNSASLAAVTGEPFEVVDLPIPDPNWSAYSSGIAAQMGIHGGVTSLTKVKDDEKFGVTGTIRFESLAHSVEIDVSANDTVKSVMDRLRAQAGDWLYVNYFDANMGNSAGQEGDVPIISIAAKDGSAVNVIDVSGAIAQDQMLLNTSVQGGVDLSGWLLVPNSGPSAAPQTFSVTVAGYTHTIDLAAMRDVNGNGQLDAQDLVATINARMQDYDVRAELNKNGKLVLWSPRGYSIEASSNLGIQITAAPAPGAPASFTADTVVAGGGPAYAGFAAKNVFTVKSSGNVAPTAAAPANPSAGDAYLDTATGEIYTYNGAAWNVAAALAADEACLVDGSGDVYYCSAPGTVTSLGTHSGTPGTLDVLDAGNTVYTYDNATDPANPRWVAYGAYGFLGNTPSSSSPYRDGYGLEGSNQPGAVRKAPGIYTQNVISRGGANQTQQNFFGVLDDIVAAVRSENRDGLSDKLLPLIDKFMDGLLKVISMGGALQGRYEASIARMKMNDITMTEAHDDVVGIDLAEISTQLLMAQTMYQASLGVISFIVQPTLLDFLR
jgi:flagellin-like hook-associated protein FlgL